MSSILLDYQARILALHAASSQLRFGQMLVFTVMSILLIALLVLLFFSLARHTIQLPLALFPAPLAIYAGVIARRRNQAFLRALRLETYYERGVDRLEGRWQSSEQTGEEYSCAGHPYQGDLHVLGEGSLYQLVCTCRTEAGRKRLAEYLLQAPREGEPLRRQQAVQELQGQAALREKINLLGEFSFQQSSWATISDWLDSPVTAPSEAFRTTALLSSACLAVLLLLGWTSAISWIHLIIWIASLMILNSALGLHYRRPLASALPAIRALSLEIGVLREGLRLLQVQKFSSPVLTEIVNAAHEGDSVKHLHRLDRLAGTIRECDKEWFYALSLALLIRTQAFLAIEKWRIQHGKALRRWLEVWADFEALMALANYAYEHPENTFPQFASDKTMLTAEGLGHPLLPLHTCVLNDVAFDEQTRFYVLSGSNMAGKSTLLRAIGLNTVLAYAGAPVFATHMTLSRFALCASLAIQDTLLNGKSKFLAEMERLKQAIQVPPMAGPVLFLIDELLAGTNSRDRRVAGELILKALLQKGAVGALSTHDLALTELANLTGLCGKNVHMASSDDDDPLNFDYLLKPGPATQSNALAIVKFAGILS